MADNKYTQAIEKAKTDLKQIKDDIQAINTAVNGLNTKVISTLQKGLGNTPKGAKENINSVSEAIKRFNKLLVDQKKLMKERENALKKQADLEYKFSLDRERQEKWQFQQMAKATRETRKMNKEKERAAEKARKASEKEAKQREKAANAARREAAEQRKLSGAYNTLVRKQQQAKRLLQELIASQSKNQKRIRMVRQEYEKYTDRVNKANAATQSFSKKGLTGAVRGIQNLMGAFGVVGGLYLFADIAKQGFQLAKRLDSINFAMRTVITDSQELARTQVFLTDITERYGAEIVTTTERYNKFLAAAKQSNVSLDDTEQIFGTMTKAAGALGLKSHELEGVFLALEQMLSKGKVTTEELRRQLGERLPGAFGIMAKAVGVSVGELDDMLKKGEVLAAEVLPKFAKEVEKAYGITNLERVENLNAASTRLSNSWTQLVQSITESGGPVSNTLITIIDLGTTAVSTFKELNETLDNSLNRGNSAGASAIAKLLKQDVEELGFTMEDAAKNRIPFLVSQLESYESKLRDLTEEHRNDAEEYTLFDKLLGKISNNRLMKTAEMVEKYREMVRVAKEAAGELADSEIYGPVRETDTEKPFSLYDEQFIKGARTYQTVLDEIKKEEDDLRALSDEMAAIEGPRRRAKIESLKEELLLWDGINEKRGKDAKELVEGSIAYAEAEISRLKELRDNVDVTSEKYKELTKELEGWQNLLDNFQNGAQGLEILIGGSYDAGNMDRSELLDQAAEAMQMEVDLENQKMEAIKAIREGGLEHYKHLTEEQVQAVEEAVELQKELQRGLYDSIGQLGESFLESRVEQVELEIEANRDKYAQILDSEEWSLEQRAAIEAERDAEERKLEKEKRKREKEAFLFKQGLALAEIGINLAKTISAIKLASMNIAATIPAPAGLTLSAAFSASNIPIAVGTAAAQAAAVVAQSIPQFEKGTDNAPEGLAIIDEKRPEVHMDKHGNIKSFGSDGGARLTYTEKGDVIKPSHDAFFKSMGYDEMQQAIFKMNMHSNGEQLSRHQVDTSLLNSVKDLKNSNEKVWKEVKKLASRPISNNVNVTVKEDSAY